MLIETPSTKHLSRMYYELGKIKANCVGMKSSWPYKAIKNREHLLALACDMSRYDPRLFEILVNYFYSHWQEINPASLRSFYNKMKTPQVICVLGEFVKQMSSDKETIFYFDYLAVGLKSVPIQYFFFDLYSPGGQLAKQAVEECLFEYKQWGFLSNARPVIDSGEKQTIGKLDSNSRRNILNRLLSLKKEITLQEYLKAIYNSVSRQQALLDLKSNSSIKPTGLGRYAKWRKVEKMGL